MGNSNVRNQSGRSDTLKLKGLSIRYKLLAAFAPAAILVIVFSFISYQKISSLSDLQNENNFSNLLEQTKDDILLLAIVFSVLTVVFSVLTAFLLSINVIGAIKRLIEAFNRFSSGDLTSNVALNRTDEFLSLAQSASKAMSTIRDLVIKTFTISSDVHTAADTVTNNAKTLLNTTKDITCSITEIEQGLLQQAEDTQSCMNQMETLSNKITVVVENSDHISEVSVSTQDAVSKGLNVIHVLNEKSDETEQAAKGIIDSIMELKTASDYIFDIVDAINEISEQTNLLSLNASIEAARAGEAGKGFAVVADEIRKLAEQSANSANQIKDYVKEITMKTETAVDFAKKSQNSVEFQRKQITQTVTMFNRVKDQVSTLADNLSNISAGITDIQKSKRDTVLAIESISAISQQTAASAEEVTANVNLQLQALEDFNLQADDLISVSSNLTDAVHLFHV